VRASGVGDCLERINSCDRDTLTPGPSPASGTGQTPRTGKFGQAGNVWTRAVPRGYETRHPRRRGAHLRKGRTPEPACTR